MAAIQVLSYEAAGQVKWLRLENDLIEWPRRDAYFDPIKDDLRRLLDPATFIGRALSRSGSSCASVSVLHWQMLNSKMYLSGLKG